MKQKTRSARKRRELWLRAGVWIFIVIFAFSIVGGALALFAFGAFK